MWTSHILQVRRWCSLIYLVLVCLATCVTCAPYYYLTSHPAIVPIQPSPLYLVQSNPHYIHHHELQPVHTYNIYQQSEDTTPADAMMYQQQYISREAPNQLNSKPPRGPLRIFFLFSRFPWPVEPLLQRIQNYFSTYTIPTQEPLLAEEIDIAPDPDHDELYPEIMYPGRPALPEETTTKEPNEITTNKPNDMIIVTTENIVDESIVNTTPRVTEDAVTTEHNM